jgi:catechol-2,3-dioxygenase
MREGQEQSMNFQGVVMNVADLERSIDFYRDVFEFTVVSQKEQLAVISASGNEGAQVIVLREFGSGAVAGARHIGLRAFVMEVESDERLQRIHEQLTSRGLFVNRREHPEWTAVVGHDPDETAVVVAHVRGGVTDRSWRTLDDFLYGVGE